MKVRVDKSENEDFKFIEGHEFEVFKTAKGRYYFSELMFINKSGCTVISDDLTKTVNHVQPEPKHYCIKRTPENAEVLNKWANSLELSLNEKFFGEDGIMCYYLKRAHIYFFNTKGFAELSTVEDFFEKVGYEPIEEIKDTDMHSQKLEHFQVASTLVGFKFKDKDLDMLVSMYDLVTKFGGKLDIDTITTKELEINERHLVKPAE